MDILNRGLLLVVPRQPFLDWANDLEHHGPDFHLDEGIPAAYLIPHFGTLDEVDRYVAEVHGRIFEEELAAWTEDPEVWPEKRGLERFYEWFSVEYTDLVADLAEEPIRVESG